MSKYRSRHCCPLFRLQEAEDREGEEAGAPEERAEGRWPAQEAMRRKGGL